jgi:hypothetical protein
MFVMAQADRNERIRYYQERAKRRLPLFDDLPLEWRRERHETLRGISASAPKTLTMARSLDSD